MQINSIPEILAQDRSTTERVEAMLTLSDDVLNAKASAESWSALQCVEHMTFVAAWYLKTFQRIADKKQRDTFWTQYSPLTKVWNSMYLSFLDPDNMKKLKAPSRAIPSQSTLSKDILTKYLHVVKELEKTIMAIPEQTLRTTVIASPIAKFITLDAFIGVQAVIMHNERHTRQAERAVKAAS